MTSTAASELKEKRGIDLYMYVLYNSMILLDAGAADQSALSSF